MTLEERIEIAQVVRGRDRFGPVSAEELAALPGTETELHITVDCGRTVRVLEERLDDLASPAPLLINYHGGGFIKGRTDRDRRYCCMIMDRVGCLVWDVDYSIAPEAPFPAAVNEAYGIMAYAFEHAQELGVDPDRIILAGHSAGGNLVAAALVKDAKEHRLHPCCALIEYAPVNQSVDPVDRLSPELKADPSWVKRAEIERLYTEFYIGDADPMDPLCSPLLAGDSDYTAFPDTLILSAGEDSLRDDTEALAQRLVKAGVCVTAQRIEEAIHGFTTNRTPGWERGLDRHVQFMTEHIRRT